MRLDCYNKTFECMNEEGSLVVAKGIPKVISVRQVSAMQLKKFCRKGCELYAAHILEATKNETLRLEDFCVLQEFKDFFPDEIPGLPPKRDIDFTIEYAKSSTNVQDTLHNEHTRNSRVEDATTRIVGEEVYQAKCVSLESTSSICKEER